MGARQEEFGWASRLEGMLLLVFLIKQSNFTKERMGFATMLTHPDIVHWHEDIADLFDHSTDESLPFRLSETLNKIIRHEAFVMKVYPAGSNLPVIISHDIPMHMHEMYFHKYLSSAYQQDPLLDRVRSHRCSQVIQINDQTCALKGTEYYRNYYRNLSLQDEIAFLVPVSSGDSFVFSIDRKAAISSKQEIAILNNTLPLLKSVLGKFGQSLTESQRGTEAIPSFSARGVDERLTAREREIVYLMISGKGTKEIARHLDISFQTVKVHRRNIYTKLDINSELQLCSMFLEA